MIRKDKFFNWVKQSGNKYLLLTVCIILFSWPYVDIFISKFLSPIQLLGIALGCLTLLAFDVYIEIVRLKPERSVYIEHVSIHEAVRLAFEKRPGRRAKRVRIFACSTEIIMPAVREACAHADLCEVILQDFDLASLDDKTRAMATKVDGYIASWKALCLNRIIDHLEIGRYNSRPDFYAVIVDDVALIFGLFRPTTDDGHVVDFIEPILVDTSTDSGERLVNKFIAQFDFLKKSCSRLVVQIDSPN